VLPGIEQLIVACAPQVASVTMMAIVRVESGGNPLAMNVNGKNRLLRQPRSRQQAIDWSEWLIGRGYSVDMGLAQVNSANLRRLNLSVADLFDPCANLAAGARILSANYADASRRFGSEQAALQAALSAYNTGNHRKGFSNGYVAKVTAAAHGRRPVLLPAPKPAANPSSAPRLAKANFKVMRERGNSTAPRVYQVERPKSTGY
jgi:type IV secretion system protein VirB1